MEPLYFVENRYSFVLDLQVRPFPDAYEVDTPETRFEHAVQSKLAVANRLLMAGKFSAALKGYKELRGLIAATLSPTLPPHVGVLVDWAKVSPKVLADGLIRTSAALLTATPLREPTLPDYVRTVNVTLPAEITNFVAPFAAVGISDGLGKVGLHLSAADKLVEDKNFKGGITAFEDALGVAETAELRAAITHDIAVMHERIGDKDKAVEGFREAAKGFKRSKNADAEASALTTLAGTLARAGKNDEAGTVLKDLEKVRTTGNLFSIITDRADFGAVRAAPAIAADVGVLARPAIRGIATPVAGAAPIAMRRSIAREVFRGDAAAAAIEPARLMASAAFADRKSTRSFSVMGDDNKLVKFDISSNAAANLEGYFDELRVTADLSLLNAYAVTGTTTVAYLTHVSLWIIPMAIGDCYAGLGWYAQAEAEYRKTLDYPYLNEVVEVVNLWLRLAELYVDWGDHLYRQARNDISEFSKSKEKFEHVIQINDTVNNNSPLYKHAKFQSMRQRATATITNTFVNGAPNTENPRLTIALMRARIQLNKIKADLNFLGMGVYVPPFSFEYMQTIARYFAQHASQVEQMYIQFQSGGENEELRETQMAQQVELADASVELERRGQEEAEEGVNVAQENEQHAQVQHDNAIATRNDFNAVKWDLLELSALQAWSSAAAQDQDDEVKQTITGYSAYSADGKRRSLVLQDLAYKRGRISNDLETARLNREVAAADAYGDVAAAQVGQAQARVEVAEQRIVLAELQKQNAQENLEFLVGREFTSAMWYNLAREARRLSGRYVDMAIEIAILMEKAYEAETGRDLRKIKFDYGSSQLNGLLGADALLLDIDYFTFDHLRTKSKKAAMRQTLSMADTFPMAYERLMRTGTTYFETTLDHFDRRYPGFYLQKVKQVELVFVGLNGTEGVHGTLRNIGLSQVRHKNGTIENQIYPADVMPLSEYNIRQDAVVFQLDSKELRLFENNGIATMWQLDLPLSSNTFNMRNILDIQLVIYYDGFHDQALENQIRAALPASASGSRGLSLRLYAPDELFFLRAQGNAQLAIAPDLFPANQTNQKLTAYTIQALGQSIGGLKLRVAYDTLGANHTFTLNGDGSIDQSAFAGPVGKSLFDTMHFTIDPSDNPGFDLAGLQDLSVFVEYSFDYRT